MHLLNRISNITGGQSNTFPGCGDGISAWCDLPTDVTYTLDIVAHTRSLASHALLPHWGKGRATGGFEGWVCVGGAAGDETGGRLGWVPFDVAIATDGSPAMCIIYRSSPCAS